MAACCYKFDEPYSEIIDQKLLFGHIPVYIIILSACGEVKEQTGNNRGWINTLAWAVTSYESASTLYFSPQYKGSLKYWHWTRHRKHQQFSSSIRLCSWILTLLSSRHHYYTTTVDGSPVALCYAPFLRRYVSYIKPAQLGLTAHNAVIHLPLFIGAKIYVVTQLTSTSATQVFSCSS